MKIPMSSRLLAVCDFIRKGDRVADIGCDHGYLGIYLLTNGIAAHMIESDVAQGPLDAARRNAARFGVGNAMTFCRSDGAQDIPRDFDVLVCAGMGADTIISILKAAPWLRSGQYRLVLQCQSKRPELRRYLYQQGYAIARETLAKDGKFVYTVMEVLPAPSGQPDEAHFYISPQLLADGSPLLPEFVERVLFGIRQTVAGMEKSGHPELARQRALLQKLEEMTYDYR